MNRTTRRRARKPHRCYGCPNVIQPGELYLMHVVSPWHDGNESPRWCRGVECAECATATGRHELFGVDAEALREAQKAEPHTAECLIHADGLLCTCDRIRHATRRVLDAALKQPAAV